MKFTVVFLLVCVSLTQAFNPWGMFKKWKDEAEEYIDSSNHQEHAKRLLDEVENSGLHSFDHEEHHHNKARKVWMKFKNKAETSLEEAKESIDEVEKELNSNRHVPKHAKNVMMKVRKHIKGIMKPLEIMIRPIVESHEESEFESSATIEASGEPEIFPVTELPEPEVLPTELPEPEVLPTEVPEPEIFPTEVPETTEEPEVLSTELPEPEVFPTEAPETTEEPEVLSTVLPEPEVFPTEVLETTEEPEVFSTELPEPEVFPTEVLETTEEPEVLSTELPEPEVLPTEVTEPVVIAEEEENILGDEEDDDDDDEEEYDEDDDDDDDHDKDSSEVPQVSQEKKPEKEGKVHEAIDVVGLAEKVGERMPKWLNKRQKKLQKLWDKYTMNNSERVLNKIKRFRLRLAKKAQEEK